MTEHPKCKIHFARMEITMSISVALTVEHEQIQKRTFTNWINAQLSKRCPPSYVSDLFSDLRDGSQLLDLLEVMSGQPMVSSHAVPLVSKS
uniref:Calponin-homology (CH) domain-containing protein n=1 Tax=Anabas testudineus TaxID=64144 RepID=A0A3Q1JBU4_ANATE